MAKKIKAPDQMKGKRQLKSRKVTLTLLSSFALAYAGCTKTEPEWKENPYDQYNYYGHAGDSGQVYAHYHNGMFQWFLLSRMFNGYGYYPPNYMPHYFPGRNRDRVSSVGGGYVGGSRYRGYYSTSAPSTGGFASSANVARGGFGSTGYGRGGGLG